MKQHNHPIEGDVGLPHVDHLTPTLRWNNPVGEHPSIENYLIPCHRCGSIHVAVIQIWTTEKTGWFNLRCQDCNWLGTIGIGQSEDFFENGGRPIVKLYTD